MFFSNNRGAIRLVSARLKNDINNLNINNLTLEKIHSHVGTLNMLISQTYNYIAQQRDLSFETVVQPRAELERLKFTVVLALMKTKNICGQNNIKLEICEALNLISDTALQNTQRADVFMVLKQYFNTVFMVDHSTMNHEQLTQVILMLRDFQVLDSGISSYVASCSFDIDIEAGCMLPPLLVRSPKEYGICEVKGPNRLPVLDLV